MFTADEEFDELCFDFGIELDEVVSELKLNAVTNVLVPGSEFKRYSTDKVLYTLT